MLPPEAIYSSVMLFYTLYREYIYEFQYSNKKKCQRNCFLKQPYSCYFCFFTFSFFRLCNFDLCGMFFSLLSGICFLLHALCYLCTAQKISMFKVQSSCHNKDYLLRKQLHPVALEGNPVRWLVFVVLSEPQYWAYIQASLIA